MNCNLENKIDDLLTFMELAEPKRGFHHNTPMSLDTFDGALALFDEFNDDRDFINPDVLSENEIRWSDTPLDIKTLCPWDLDKKGKMQANRVRKIPFKSVRGKLKRYASSMYEISGAIIDHDGSYSSGSFWLGISGDSYIDLSRPIGRADADAIKLFKMGSSIALTERYQWHAIVGMSANRRISFSTDPIGAREIFRLRDIPEGKERRTALRHWVKEHWRKNRSDSQERSKVMAHLRGATKFHWNGLHVELRPSEYDLMKLNEAKIV